MKTLFVVPRPRPPFLAVLLFALLASCGPLNRGLGGLSATAGRGAVTGARDGLGTDTTKAALDGLIGAVTAGVGRGIGNDVSPEIRKLARGLFLSGQAFLGAAGDSIRGPLAASIDSLIVGRTALLGHSIDARIDPLLGRIGERARFEIDSTIAVVGASANRSLGPLADSMVDRVSRRLADNLDHKLGAAVERLVKRTGDSAGNAAGSILWKIALP
ncbi:MAG TPA: hypothetical protein VFQ39_09730, partial [Longimicrobium sp.]|nr:hypothetical protein [Longimicrobium sp.]